MIIEVDKKEVTPGCFDQAVVLQGAAQVCVDDSALLGCVQSVPVYYDLSVFSALLTHDEDSTVFIVCREENKRYLVEREAELIE